MSSKINVSCDNQKDLFQFISHDQYPLYLHIFVFDDVESIQSIKEELGENYWCQFIRSYAVKKKTNYQLSNLGDIVVCTNPFLLAVYYGAVKICAFIKDNRKDVELHKLTEEGFNAIHYANLGIFTGTIDTTAIQGGIEQVERLTDEEGAQFFLTFFYRKLFTHPKEVSEMLNQPCDFGVNPMELLVLLRRPDIAEITMFINPFYRREHEIKDTSEQIKIDISSYKVEHLMDIKRFFLSPLFLLLDCYSLDTQDLEECKKLGIFRNDFLFSTWTKEMIERNRSIIQVTVSLQTIMMIMMLWFLAPYPIVEIYRMANTKYQKTTGEFSSMFTREITVISAMLTYFIILLTCISCYILTKTIYRWRIGFYTFKTLKNDKSTWDMIKFNFAVFVTNFALVGLLLIYLQPEKFCIVAGKYAPQIASGLTIICVLSTLYSHLFTLRCAGLSTVFMTGLVESINTFFIFALFYLLLLYIFSTFFHTIALSLPTSAGITKGNETTSYEALYLTFLVTLNIINQEVFSTYSGLEEKHALLSIHFFFVLMVPVFFLNFIIGVLSLRLSVISDHEVEVANLLQLNMSLLAEYAFSTARYLLYMLRRSSVVANYAKEHGNELLVHRVIKKCYRMDRILNLGQPQKLQVMNKVT